MAQKPKVALIGTGGTISAVGKGPLDLQDYTETGRMLHADELLARFPDVASVADVTPVRFRAVPSTAISFPEWKEVVLLADKLVTEQPGLAGIVVNHGTATLEETAYALSLTAKVPVPIVLVGAQRPSSALSTDAGLNLVNAVRTAASPDARGLGVLVVLNDEIHAAREVTKTSNFRLQTFRTPDFGALGHCDGDAVAFYRRPLRRAAPDTEFDIRTLERLPRVDIAYGHAGSDGTAVRAFVEAGAEGIVAAGLPPGMSTPADYEALKAAAAGGVIVLQSSRAMSGRTYANHRSRAGGFLAADNLTPQKARILLALALTRTRDKDEIRRIFATY
ncbi:MAG: asparaginase [Hyphomicrobiaceae bacterium]